MGNFVTAILALGGLSTVLEGCAQLADVLTGLEPLLP